MLSTLEEKHQGTQVSLYRLRGPNVRLQVAFGFDIEISIKKALPRNNKRKLGKRHMLQKMKAIS